LRRGEVNGLQFNLLQVIKGCGFKNDIFDIFGQFHLENIASLWAAGRRTVFETVGRTAVEVDGPVLVHYGGQM